MARPVKLPGGQSLDIHSWGQGVISVWATLPKEVRAKDISAERVGARLKGHLDAIEWGLLVAEFPVMPKKSEMLAYRLELAGRDLDGRSTPKTMARWRTDLSGLVFDLHVHDVARQAQLQSGATVSVPAHESRAASIVFNPTGLSILAKHTIWKMRLWQWIGDRLWRLGHKFSQPVKFGTPIRIRTRMRFRIGAALHHVAHRFFDTIHQPIKGKDAKFHNAAVLAIPVHLQEGSKLVIRCRFPKGWKASRQWQIMFALVGLRKEPLK